MFQCPTHKLTCRRTSILKRQFFLHRYMESCEKQRNKKYQRDRFGKSETEYVILARRSAQRKCKGLQEL